MHPIKYLGQVEVRGELHCIVCWQNKKSATATSAALKLASQDVQDLASCIYEDGVNSLKLKGTLVTIIGEPLQSNQEKGRQGNEAKKIKVKRTKKT